MGWQFGLALVHASVSGYSKLEVAGVNRGTNEDGECNSYKARVWAGGTPKFEKSPDSFMQVVPQTSMVVLNARSGHRIFDCSRRCAVSVRVPPALTYYVFQMKQVTN